MFKKRKVTAEELVAARRTDHENYKELDRKYYAHVDGILLERRVKLSGSTIGLRNNNSDSVYRRSAVSRNKFQPASNSNRNNNKDSQTPKSHDDTKRRASLFSSMTAVFSRVKQRVMTVARCGKLRSQHHSIPSQPERNPPETCLEDLNHGPVTLSRTITENDMRKLMVVDRLTSKLLRVKDEEKQSGRWNRRRVLEESIPDPEAEELELKMHLRWLAHQYETNPLQFVRSGSVTIGDEESSRAAQESESDSSSSSSWETDTDTSSDSDSENSILYTPTHTSKSLCDFGNMQQTLPKEFNSCPIITRRNQATSFEAKAEAIQSSEDSEPQQVATESLEAEKIRGSVDMVIDSCEILMNESPRSLDYTPRSLSNLRDPPKPVAVTSCPISIALMKTRLNDLDESVVVQLTIPEEDVPSETFSFQSDSLSTTTSHTNTTDLSD